MADFNEEEFKKRVEENRKFLSQYKKDQESNKINQDYINKIMSLNSLVTFIVIAMGIAAYSLYYFGQEYIDNNPIIEKQQTETVNKEEL